MKQFIECLQHAGAFCQNEISVEVLFNPVNGNPYIRAAFSMNRFSNPLNHLRFDREICTTWKRRILPHHDVDTFYSKLAKDFVAGESINDEEQPVPFRDRCKFIQYMSSVPGKYGIKIFWGCDAKMIIP